MLFSAFTPLDLFELSGEEPLAEQIYKGMTGGLGDQYDLTVGESRMEAFCFASSLASARAAKCLERGALQNRVDVVDDMMPTREDEYSIVPGFSDTLADRRAEYARRKVRPGTWTRAAITAQLQELLGDDFIAYRPTTVDEAVIWPAALGDSPMLLAPSTVTRKIVRLTQAISIGLGAPQNVPYELVDVPISPDAAGTLDLVAGDQIVVDPHMLGISECVTVVSVESTQAKTLRATFNLPHDPGALGFTHPFPRWESSKRHSLVVLTPEAADDPEKRRVVDFWMRRMARGCSTWSVVGSADGETTGEFEIGSSLIGEQTHVDITL